MLESSVVRLVVVVRRSNQTHVTHVVVRPGEYFPRHNLVLQPGGLQTVQRQMDSEESVLVYIPVLKFCVNMPVD